MLTDTKARTAKPQERPYKLRDSHGLYLEVKPTGARLWRYRYKIAGRENVFALGIYPDVGLAEARALRDGARKLVKQGIHPSHARREERLRATFEAATTFETIALEWVEAKRTRWSEGYHRQCVDTLRRDVLPFLGRLPIRQISPAHVLRVLKRIEARGSQAVALQARQWDRRSIPTCHSHPTIRSRSHTGA